MQVLVETVEVSPPKFDSRKAIDWSNASDRKWLTNHIHWALHNGRRVTIENESN